MKIFLALIVGIAIGITAVWYLNKDKNRSQFDTAADQIKSTAQSAGAAVEDKLRSLDLNGDKVSDELNRTGRVIRDKAGAAGQKIADATADARITAAIKAKIVGTRDLSALDISVSTTDGIVTLAGTAPSADGIGKAMLLALETDGVRQVISTLKVKPR